MPKTQSRVSVEWKAVATERTVSIDMTDAGDNATLFSPQKEIRRSPKTPEIPPRLRREQGGVKNASETY
jgi:hypothetical protein